MVRRERSGKQARNERASVVHVDGRMRVTYALHCKEEDPHVKARDIALEQTVELPAGTFSREIEERMVGRVESLDRIDAVRWKAVLSYDLAAVGEDLPQLLNLLFGNISLKAGIRLLDVDWPAPLLARFCGPKFGIPGLRELCSVAEPRPLLCAALKPMGLSAHELAALCEQFALGGIDVIKDDHGLVNQPAAPFKERIQRCQEAVARANRRTGGNSLYVPNVTGGFQELPANVDVVRAAGCRGVLISPLLVGLDTVRWLAEDSGLAILAHPSMMGAFFAPDHGIAPALFLGEILRIIGSDGVIYPNAGGRFPFSEATCEAINRNLRRRLGTLRPALPVPAGGISVDRMPSWVARYGGDTMFLLGSSLYEQRDLKQASQRLLDAIKQPSRGTP